MDLWLVQSHGNIDYEISMVLMLAWMPEHSDSV